MTEKTNIRAFVHTLVSVCVHTLTQMHAFIHKLRIKHVYIHQHQYIHTYIHIQVVGACGMLTSMLIEAEAAYENDILLAGVVIRALPLLIPYYKEHPQATPQIISRILSRYKIIKWTPQDDEERKALVRCVYSCHIYIYIYIYMYV